MKAIEDFFAFARERYAIKLRREAGLPREQWTDDPVLQNWFFCNIFREDDKVTTWFRENIREPLRDDIERVSLATVAFRWFNYIPTGELIKDVLLSDGWNKAKVRKLLRNQGRLFTGAYIIMPRPGISMGKLDAVLWCMDRYEPFMLQWGSMEEAHAHLMMYPGMGPFMAYEVICDLRYTAVLEHATDAFTWANPGPGAKRGLKWIMGDIKPKNMLIAMQGLLAESADTTHWPANLPPWDMRTVEHTLCEYSKYMQAREGKALKRRYR